MFVKFTSCSMGGVQGPCLVRLEDIKQVFIKVLPECVELNGGPKFGTELIFKDGRALDLTDDIELVCKKILFVSQSIQQ